MFGPFEYQTSPLFRSPLYFMKLNFRYSDPHCSTYLVSSHWWRQGQQKRCPHIEITASEATSKQMLHSKAESFRSSSSFPVLLFSFSGTSLLRAPVSGHTLSVVVSSPTFSSLESSIVPSSAAKKWCPYEAAKKASRYCRKQPNGCYITKFWNFFNFEKGRSLKVRKKFEYCLLLLKMSFHFFEGLLHF